jgi:hypothetical protein
VLFPEVGITKGDVAAWLTYFAGKTTVWWAILRLPVLTDLLFVPFALALYRALEEINRPAMLLASAFVGLFVVLDLAVTWANYASLLTLRDEYAAAANDAQRAGYIAAANYASAVLTSRLEIVYAILVLSLAILINGIVMLQGAFGKATAYLCVITGLLGIVSLAGVDLLFRRQPVSALSARRRPQPLANPAMQLRASDVRQPAIHRLAIQGIVKPIDRAIVPSASSPSHRRG